MYEVVIFTSRTYINFIVMKYEFVYQPTRQLHSADSYLISYWFLGWSRNFPHFM